MKKSEAIIELKFGTSLKDLKEFADDKELVAEAIEANWQNIKYSSEKLKDDKEIAILAISRSANAFKQISERLKNDIDILIKLFDISHKLSDIRVDLLKDKVYLEGVLNVKSSEHKIIEMLDDETMEKYADIIFDSILTALSNINYDYSDGLTVRKLLYKVPLALGLKKKNISIEIDSRIMGDIPGLNNEEFYGLLLGAGYTTISKCMDVKKHIAATNNLKAIEYLDKENIIEKNEIDITSQNDKITSSSIDENKEKNKQIEIILSDNEIRNLENAILNRKLKISELPPYLRKDKEFIERVIDQNPDIVTKSLGFSQLHFLYAISKDAKVLKKLYEILNIEEEFLLKAIKVNPESLDYCPDSYKKNRSFILEAMKNNGNALKFSYKRFINDIDIVSAAARNNPESLKYAGSYIKNNKIFKEIIKNFEKN